MINSAFLSSPLQLNGFRSTHIAYCESEGLGLCFSAYAEHSAGENILEIGFNSNSGYVYIALENGVTICSAFGRSVEYLVSDWNTGEEHFFDTYHEAETFEPLDAE